MNNGLIHALVFDKKGAAKNIDINDIHGLKYKDDPIWLHFNYENEDTQNYLKKNSKLDEIVSDALLTNETRPRVASIGNNLLIALRGVNLNPNSDPEDMVSIRLYIEENLIITTKRRDLLSVNDIVIKLKRGNGPKSSIEFLIDLCDALTNRMQGVIENLDEKVSLIEEILLEDKSGVNRTEILSLKKETLIIKRYISPQKEALNRLCHEKISWINEHDRMELKEITDSLYRYVEEIDTIKDRISYIQEELSNKLNEQMNSKMYLLSIISAIFLPLGFLTGLLGINVGGIPGAENQNSFMIFVGILFTIGIFQYIYFKNKKWF